MSEFLQIIWCSLLLHSVQCALVNVARDQPARQSSIEATFNASRANDGNKTNVEDMYKNSCAHTKATGHDTAWWQVDLGKTFYITYILLTSRNWTGGPSRLAGFSVYVSDIQKETWTSEELCFQDSDPRDGVAYKRMITCDHGILGRFLTIYNKRPPENGKVGYNYSSTAILELCEVNVPIRILGCADDECNSCNIGWYGIRCERSCANCGGGQGCNRTTGYCNSQSCLPGYYGQSCTSSCRATNCFDNKCDFNSGLCQKCYNPFYGSLCNQRCSSNCASCNSDQNCFTCNNGRYGDMCSSNCSFCGGNGDCNKQSGICNSNSCKPGFYGYKCESVCASSCGNDRSCDYYSGFCSHCPEGKYGNVCENNCTIGCRICSSTYCLNCSNGYQGVNCNQNCFGCGGGGSCHRYTGQCTSNSCKPKYYGYVNNMYKCDKSCSSYCGDDGSCHFQTGSCNYECKNGYMGENCYQSCPINCAGIKSCARYSGKCSDGCNDGWFGDQCNKTCSSNCGGISCNRETGACISGCEGKFYGSDCSQMCPTNCGGNGLCDKERGICTSRCKQGWNGTKCESKCAFPKFGEDCSKECGHCKNGSCNHITGECMQGCNTGWVSTLCNKVSKLVDEPIDVNAGVIGGSAGAVVIVVIIIVIVVIVLLRRTRGSKKGRAPTNGNGYMYSQGSEPGITTQNAMYTNIMSVKEEQRASKPEILTPKPVVTQSKPPKNVDESDTTYYNSIDIKKEVAVSELKAYVANKLSTKKYEEEFQAIPYGAIHPTTVAETPTNMKKNRFKTTFPYDHSRVILKGKSDYINANFVEDANGVKKYIATQGPIPNTIEDFWQMVWEYNIDIIVMLTNLQEGKKRKCEQYWPKPNEKMTYGQFGLSLLDERHFSYYSLRELEVLEAKSKQSRKILQYHFTTWPDHGTPDPLFLVLFHKRVISKAPKYDGPILVHCSAGIGRTGTFIALDALESQGNNTRAVDIENYVRIMRKDRMNMIQTSEQYKVLHEALVEAFQWKDTYISMDDFPSVWQSIETDKRPLNQQRLKKEYDMLREMKGDSENPVSAIKEENKAKNRTDSILPLDKHRPYLSSYFAGGNDFINSVIIPSHLAKDGFMVTQVPLQGTIVDFWRLITDHDSRCIVYFAQSSDEETSFYPSHEDVTDTEMHHVKKVSSNTLLEGVEEVKMKVKGKKSNQTKDVTLLKIDMAGKNYPTGAQIFRVVEIVELQRNRNKNCPCTVISIDGCTPCEVFCAISNILEYMKVDNRIDVFQTARQLQIRRPEFFGTFETYRYCYQMINEYLMTQSVYFNM